MTDLYKKIDRAIKLIKSIPSNEIELCYSGGKDSDVILRLAKLAKVSVVPIYKSTTIDPVGTLKHVASVDNIQIVRPKLSMLEIIAKHGMPTMRSRHCCSILKEYPILPSAILGIRRDESVKRATRYFEPEICRIYSAKKRVKQYLPILDWTLDDVSKFIEEEGIILAPHYYVNGVLDVTRRLGCIGCPLKSDRGLSDFRTCPKMGRLWLKSVVKWWDLHPLAKSRTRFSTPYELFVHNLFYKTYESFYLAKTASLTPLDAFDVCLKNGWI